MLTLSIRYTIDPNKFNDFKEYVEAELEPIRKSGGKIVGYFYPTEFSGATNEALGLIDFPSLAEYEVYRKALADDPGHKRSVTRLQQSGAVIAMNRSILERAQSSNSVQS